jgi:hypothetical protein
MTNESYGVKQIMSNEGLEEARLRAIEVMDIISKESVGYVNELFETAVANSVRERGVI